MHQLQQNTGGSTMMNSIESPRQQQLQSLNNGADMKQIMHGGDNTFSTIQPKNLGAAVDSGIANTI